jgi:hypothetical protein
MFAMIKVLSVRHDYYAGKGEKNQENISALKPRAEHLTMALQA